jgi:Proteasome subunit
VTLAVAACFPWGREREIANSRPAGSDLERGVVLATDSRFSYAGGVRVDVGRKIYVLEPNVALIYAGDVSAAQRAVSDVQAFVGRRTPGSQISKANVVQQYLQQAYAKAIERKRRRGGRHVQPLRVLIGVYDHKAQRPHVLAFSSDSNFVPKTGVQVHALGADIDVRNFGEALSRRNREREELAVHGLDWQFDVVVSMRAALEPPTKQKPSAD